MISEANASGIGHVLVFAAILAAPSAQACKFASTVALLASLKYCVVVFILFYF